MAESTKALYKSIGTVVFVLMLLLIVLGDEAKADHKGWHKETTINNYYTTEVTEVTEVTQNSMTIAGGVDRHDLLSLSSSVLAGGAHQFDYSTTHWQLSLTGDFATSDWDADNEFSIGVGKRFGKDSWVPNALFHGAYTPVLDDNHVTLGVTIVLD